MSRFLLITGAHADRWTGDVPVQRLRSALDSDHTPAIDVQRVAGAVAVVARPQRQSGADVVARDDLLVVADAALYYRRELQARLGEEAAPAGDSAAALIAAAFRQRGVASLEWLEGDFAFAIWDARTGQLFAARDAFGTRSLFYRTTADGTALATLPDPLRTLGGDAGLEARDLIRSLVMYHGDGCSTPWRGITELPAGWQLTRGPGSAPSARRYWYPRERAEWSTLDAVGSGEVLCGLLADAASERAGQQGTAIGMSGGRDSTAIVGAVEDRRRKNNALSSLTVLSFKYPDGDPGNEDVFVNTVAQSLGLSVQWLETEAMPVLQDAAGRPERRVRPEPQPFEGQNRALAVAARRSGADVLFNGNGGDNLFGLNDVWLSDLLRTGRWLQLRREMQRRGKRSWRRWRGLIRPAFSPRVFDAAEIALRRRILSRPWEQHAPPWLRPGLLEREGIVTQDREHYRREIDAVARNATERLRLWAFLYSGFTRNNAALYEMSRNEGVELRMPFYDPRIADFAWSRPPWQLTDGREPKLVLQRAMQGRLPDSVIAPRPRKTGLATGYFRRMARRELPAVAREVTEAPRLADLGLVEPAALRHAVDTWMAGDLKHEPHLFVAIGVELWLRAQENTPVSLRLAEALRATG